MRYHTLPGTELHVAAICMGSTSIGSAIDPATSFRLLDVYAEAGGNFVDTASVYANWLPVEKHASEKTIGRWLKQSGRREQFVVATKGAHPELATMHIARMSRREIEADLNASLRNLQTDVIDLYWLHRDDPTQPVEDILETMNAQVRAGKIRHFGCSNWSAARITAAQQAAADMGVDGFVADQMMWSLAVIDPAGIPDKTTVAMNPELYAYHMQSGMAALAYSSQAGGLFHKLVAGNDAVGRAYPLGPNRERLKRVQSLCAQTGLTITQVVLGFLMAQPFVTVPIVGCRTEAQLRDSLTAADVTLTPEQVDSLRT
jgi:aryl-alcohol dehydrogenase-like predicted oxidoreductase